MSTDKIADLKAKFVAGAILLDSDYATLLNMLEETRVATGTSPDAPKSTSLKLSKEGYLDVAVAADGGLVTGASGLSTDTRMLWARNHAITTGASQYGIWDGGYAFIYILEGDGKRKLQFCVEDVKNYPPYINEKHGFVFFNADDTSVASGFMNPVFESVVGWSDRGNKSGNTFYFDNNETVYHTLQFYTGTSPETHRATLTLLTV